MIHRTFSGNRPPQSSSQIVHLRKSCKQLAPPFGSFGGIKEYDFLCLSLRSPCPLTANLPCASDVRLQTVRLPWVCVVHSGSGSLVSAFPSSPSFRSLSCVRSFRSSGSCLCCVFVRACNLQPFGWPHYTNQIAQLVWLVCSVFVRFTRSSRSFALLVRSPYPSAIPANWKPQKGLPELITSEIWGEKRTRKSWEIFATSRPLVCVAVNYFIIA